MSVMPETSSEARLDDGEEPVASKPPLRCVEWGYEIRSSRVLRPCPMCRKLSWEQAPWRPFTRSGAA